MENFREITAANKYVCMFFFENCDSRVDMRCRIRSNKKQIQMKSTFIICILLIKICFWQWMWFSNKNKNDNMDIIFKKMTGI